MHKQNAVWLRHAFKRIEQMETSEKPNASYVEIKVGLAGARGQARATDAYLCFSKDGEVVAMAPITNADLKRLKGDMNFVAKLRSRSAPRSHA